MTTSNRMQRLLLDRGYTLTPDRGFVSGHLPDGESLSLFAWANDIVAEQSLLPRKYLVICTAAGRWRLPTVQWERFLPIGEQVPRAWSEVLTEFDSVFLPALSSTCPMPALDDERYGLAIGLNDVLEGLGYTLVKRTGSSLTFERDRVPLTSSVQGRRLTVDVGDDPGSLELTSGATWVDVAEWVRTVGGER